MLHIDNEELLCLGLSDVIGASIAVLGITGTGKSNTVGVLAEELLAQGLPMTFIDPEGELYGLKERFPLLVIGRSDQAELDIDPGHAADLAKLSVERGLSMILDLSEHSQEEQEAFLLPYLAALWEGCRKAQRPYVVAIEEAHEYLPQGGRSPLKSILTRMALRGRKRGLSLILASQRSAKVDKDVLTQTSLLFLHQVLHPVDLEVYKALIPAPAKEVESQVRALQRGQAITIAHQQRQTVQIRRRFTFHPSATPNFEEVAQPTLLAVDGALLAELRELLATPGPPPVDKDMMSRLHARIRALEEENEALRRELEALRGTRAEENHVERVSVGYATVGNLLVREPIVDVQPIALVSKAAAPVAVVEPLATRPNPQEQGRLTKLTQKLKGMESYHKKLLRLLVDHEGEWLTTDQIATWLYLQPATVRGAPPNTLLQLHLVERVHMKSGYRYKSILRQHLAQYYPRLDTDALMQQVLASF